MPDNMEIIASKRPRKLIRRTSTESITEDNKIGSEEDQEQQNQDLSISVTTNTTTTTTTTTEAAAATTTTVSKSSTVSKSTTGIATTAPFIAVRKINFKKNCRFSYLENGGKKFVWKSLKQIITQEEKQLMTPTNENGAAVECFNYASLNAPPSLRPAKKYSDLSGLEAFYTDPQTKLHYHNIEEFRIVRTLASDIIQGYLALRGATNIVG